MNSPGDASALFGVDNLPYGVYSVGGGARRIAVRLADEVIDVGLLLGEEGEDAVFGAPTLNGFMGQGSHRWADVRRRIQSAISTGRYAFAARPVAEVSLHLAWEVGDYVDYYASEHHASNLGRIFRPGNADPLLPNWKHLPVSYHGRSSSVVVSGSDIVRPRGQQGTGPKSAPTFGPTAQLDIEAELGFVLGVGSTIGTSITTAQACEHIFGVVLVNDWSARDIQAWEYVPLGPNLGKSFASTVSAWVTPMLALESARVCLPPQEPAVLPYLHMDAPWGLDIELSIEWNGEVVSRPPYTSMYWSPAQMLAHMTVNGAPTRTGDLFASGTISGERREQRGALIELTWGGEEPVKLRSGTRAFLEDGDAVVLHAVARGSHGTLIGMGEASGVIRAAPA